MAHKAVFRLMAFALVGAVSILSAASAERKEAQAQILEQESFPCVNCFFGVSDYFFCMATDNTVLIARSSIPTFNWTDGQKNYFGKVHKAWKNPTPPDNSVKIQYDDKHVWTPRADGKQTRMTLDYSRDIFTNPRCRAVVKKPAGS